MSGPKHSATIAVAGARKEGEDGLIALFEPSCLCGWRGDHVYSSHARAVRAYYRHLGQR